MSALVPTIVASGTLASQTTTQTITMFTTSQDGLFSASFYATFSGGSGSVSLKVTYTDENGSTSVGNNQNVRIIRAVAGTNIDLVATVTGTTTYNMEYALVQLI